MWSFIIGTFKQELLPLELQAVVRLAKDLLVLISWRNARAQAKMP